MDAPSTTLQPELPRSRSTTSRFQLTPNKKTKQLSQPTEPTVKQYDFKADVDKDPNNCLLTVGVENRGASRGVLKLTKCLLDASRFTHRIHIRAVRAGDFEMHKNDPGDSGSLRDMVNCRVWIAGVEKDVEAAVIFDEDVPYNMIIGWPFARDDHMLFKPYEDPQTGRKCITVTPDEDGLRRKRYIIRQDLPTTPMKMEWFDLDEGDYWWRQPTQLLKVKRATQPRGGGVQKKKKKKKKKVSVAVRSGNLSHRDA